MVCRIFYLCTINYDGSNKISLIINNLQNVQLDPFKKQLLQNRYIPEIKEYENKSISISFWFNILRVIVSFGSVIIPALLTINKYKNLTYWISWAISLLVTLCNIIIQLFQLDKKYFLYSQVLHKLEAEGWNYLQLCGKYSNFTNRNTSFVTFCNNVESIIKQADDFCDLEDKSNSKDDKLKKKNPNNQSNDLDNISDITDIESQNTINMNTLDNITNQYID